MDNKLQEKEKMLKNFRKGLVQMEINHKEHLKILKEHITVKEAYQLYKSGKLTKEEYEKYAGARESLEANVRWYPETKASTERIIKQLEADVKGLKKEQARKYKIAAVLLAPLIAYFLEKIFRWLETKGCSFHPLIYDILFCVFMLGIVFDVFLLLSLIGRQMNEK